MWGIMEIFWDTDYGGSCLILHASREYSGAHERNIVNLIRKYLHI